MEEGAAEETAAAVAEGALRILSLHSGPLTARLIGVFEKAHVYGRPPSDTPFAGLADTGQVPPRISAWLSALLALGGPAEGMGWRDYVVDLPDTGRQVLADQILSSSLCLQTGHDFSESLQPPKPENRRPVANIDPWAISATGEATLFDVPSWLAVDGGYSLRDPAFRLADDRLPKGRRLMRALQHQVREVFEATAITDEDFAERVAIKTVGSLMLIQSLWELFALHENAKPKWDAAFASYCETHKDASDAVVGLKLIRNSETHDPYALLGFDAHRVLTAFYVDGTSAYRQVPRWKPYVDLPPSVQTGPRVRQPEIDGYTKHVGGALVIESLLAAMRFFLDCDPRLARLSLHGLPVAFPLEGFPLPIDFVHGYEQPHPYLPTAAERAATRLEELRARPPAGTERRITCQLTAEDGSVLAYCGRTVVNPAYQHTFKEPPFQIARDVGEHGYRYVVGDDEVEVTVAGEELMADRVRLTELALPDADKLSKFWRVTWDLALDEVEDYARDRRGG